MKGTLRQRGPNTWQLVVSAGRDPHTNRYRQVTRTFHGSKGKAERALRALIAEVEEGRHKATTLTFGSLLDEWLDLRTDDLSPKTLDTWRGYARKRIQPALGDVPLAKLQVDDLDQFYRRLRRRDHLAPATVRQIHRIVSGALKMAQRKGWVAANVASLASLPSARAAEVVPPETGDVRRLLDVLEERNPELATFVWLAAATGARRGELCALRWSDVEPDAVCIARSISVAGRFVTEKDTKAHQGRRIALDPLTLAVLERHRLRMSERARLGHRRLVPDPYIFSRALDCSTCWNPEAVTGEFRRVRATLDLKSLRLHDLRHLQASRLMALGLDVVTVAGRLGHRDASTTLRVYSHFQKPRDRVASDLFAADVLGELGTIER